MTTAELTFLGQAGVLLRVGKLHLCVDPYLTDSVAERFGEDLRRMVPPPAAPGELNDLDWILLTHAHLDHTDLATLLPLTTASPQARIIAPWESRDLLLAAGFPHARLLQPPPSWMALGDGLQVKAVPAAHLEPEQNAAGEWRHVGYRLRWPDASLYHAGDTIPHPVVLAELAKDSAPDWALLPVNERNYFRERRDIVGNMTVREAYEFAEVIGARRVIPLHWDLFRPNSVSREEIELIHRLQPRGFELHLLSAGDTVPLAASSLE